MSTDTLHDYRPICRPRAKRPHLRPWAAPAITAALLVCFLAALLSCVGWRVWAAYVVAFLAAALGWWVRGSES